METDRITIETACFKNRRANCGAIESSHHDFRRRNSLGMIVTSPGQSIPLFLSWLLVRTAVKTNDLRSKRWSGGERGLMASRRILLVEDSSTMRRMLSTMLREEGFEVETANDGLQGLAKARLEPRPELILTDYEMPELDGAGLCRAVKADKELRSIPVLMLTTLGETREQDRRARGRRRRLHPEAEGPGRLPRVVRADPGSPADRRPPRRSWPSATACSRRRTRS